MNATAITTLKTLAGTRFTQIQNLGGTLRQMMDDKGFPVGNAIVMSKGSTFGDAVSQLVLGLNDFSGNSVLDYFAKTIRQQSEGHNQTYTGSVDQNSKIDRAIANSGSRNDLSNGRVHGEGATNFFMPATRRLRNYIINQNLSFTPIAIIGHGPAGIMTATALNDLGFKSIRIYEKRTEDGGIWKMPNVNEGSKNNPRAIDFLDHHLSAAPGPGYDITSFFNGMSYHTQRSVERSSVTAVRPGNLQHVVVTSKDEKSFPIVINCIGLGKPKAISDPRRMVTSSVRSAGPRWQQRLERKQVEGKRLVFIGLGNSTAEMLRQMHDFMDQGVDTDYRVVTHYPEEAIWNPRSQVIVNKSPYRVFRDLSTLSLVDYQGDLPDSLSDYNRALLGRKIMYGVRRWETAENGTFITWNHAGKHVDSFKYDQVYTLIGLEHDRATIEGFGCKYDQANNCAMYDYDGEMIVNEKALGGDRLFKGYYGLGAVLDAPWNRNAIVIPGIMHRLGDLLFGVINRSLEYADRSR